MATNAHGPSEALLQRLIAEFSFQISVDVDTIKQGLVVAAAALAGGVDIVELGTPLLKFEGVHNVVPAFRSAFPDAILLADMKTMDGGGGEARKVFEGGGNIIDFLALAGVASARGAVAARDEFRERQPKLPRLVFADILLPQQGPAGPAIDAAEMMLAAGVDGVGVHLQLDARVADPTLFNSSYFPDVVAAVQERVGGRASLQVVGGLSIARARGLVDKGLKAFVISGNMGHPDTLARYGNPPGDIERFVADFISAVGGRKA
jgi:3-hexulose-6-phosphate synthase